MPLPFSFIPRKPNARFTIAFCGDSITNSCSGSYGATPYYAARGYAGWAASLLEHAFVAARNKKTMYGIGEDMDFGWDGMKASEYLSSDTAIRTWPNPDAYEGYNLTPVEHALAQNADAHVLLIGTNDLNTVTAATCISTLTDLVAAFRCTHKPLYLGTILPRVGNTVSPTVEPFQDRIDTVNAALPDISAAAGTTLVSWHEQLMDEGEQNGDYFHDGIHPNTAGAFLMGQTLATALSGNVGSAYVIPAKGAGEWITSNAYMDIDTTPANGIPDGCATSYFSSQVSSVSASGWSIEEETPNTSVHYLYSPAPSGIAAAAGTSRKFRAVCRYDVVDGAAIGSVQLLITFYTSGGSTIVSYVQSNSQVCEPPFPAHSGMLLTEKFSVPATANSAACTFRYHGKGKFLIKQLGVFEIL